MMYGLADSPVTLAAWMINHDASSYADIAAAFAGHPVGSLTRDEVLDNVTFTWLTNTGVSSARLYWENTAGFFNVKGVSVPAAVSVFPNEIYKAPRSWAERAYPKLIYFNELDRGNHFAAWQEPGLFSAELRAAFRSLPAGKKAVSATGATWVTRASAGMREFAGHSVRRNGVCGSALGTGGDTCPCPGTRDGAIRQMASRTPGRRGVHRAEPRRGPDR
jgi:hypothetical protein